MRHEGFCEILPPVLQLILPLNNWGYVDVVMRPQGHHDAD